MTKMNISRVAESLIVPKSFFRITFFLVTELIPCTTVPSEIWERVNILLFFYSKFISLLIRTGVEYAQWTLVSQDTCYSRKSVAFEIIDLCCFLPTVQPGDIISFLSLSVK